MKLSREKPYNPAQEHHCETVQEFLTQLAVGGPLFRSGSWAESPWAFRGNGNSFPLVPSALRPGAEFITRESNGRWTKIQPNNTTYANRAKCELDTLLVFFYQADRHGLPLPEDSQRLRERLQVLVEELKREKQHWPPQDILSVMAIAQHHGIPTRLLDWSYDSFTAAYFAAEDASRRVRTEMSKQTGWRDLRGLANPENWPEALSNRKLEVWAINLVESDGSQVGDDSPRPHIRVVTAPRAGNENLHAQRGLFTLPIERGIAPWDSKTPYEIVPLEQMILKWNPLYGRSPFIIRLTLPLCRGSALLGRLVQHGITAGRLFPGYDGVVKGLRERALFHENFLDFSFV